MDHSSDIHDQVFAWHHVRKNLDPWRVRNYKYSRGVNGDDVTRILFEEIVLAKSPARALDRILQLSALQKYYNMLDTEREKNDFRRHAAKYVNIWLPDCAFEISFTNRYMVDQWEGKTTARKFIKAGEKIKYLCGELVQIIVGEDDDDRFIENAFSITYSSRRKTPSLFLGPARFSNHDCHANAKLESRGNEGMCVIAVRDIEVGDEINVHYGENYFGEANCECLCAYCEKNGQGAWQAAAEVDGMRTPRAGSMEAADPGSRRSKRKRHTVDYKQRLREANTRMEGEHPTKRKKMEIEYTGRAQEWTPTPETKGLHNKSQAKTTQRSTTTAAIRPAHARTAAMLALVGRPELPPRSSSVIKSEYESSPHRNRWGFSVSPASGDRGKCGSKRLSRCSASRVTDRPPKHYPHKSHMLFAFLKRETFEDDHKVKPKQSPPPLPNISSIEMEVEHSQESTASSEEVSLFDIDQILRRSASTVTEPPSGEDRIVESEHVSLSGADVYNEDQATTPKKRGRPPNPLLGKLAHPLALITNTTSGTPSSLPENSENTNLSNPSNFEDRRESIQPIAVTELTTATLADATACPSKKLAPVSSETNPPSSPTLSLAITAHRIPGDYVRTPRLLGPRNSRWVECRTCDDVFIQHDAHQTRRECPRCERHSKLYGFRWPQTDYERNNEGNGSKRVMDHRTVNRFLSRAEEMEVSRRGRGCVNGVGRRESSARDSAAVEM